MIERVYYAIHYIVGIMVTWFSALGSLRDNLIQNARMTTVYYTVVTQLTDMHQGHKGLTCYGNNTQHHLKNFPDISNFTLIFFWPVFVYKLYPTPSVLSHFLHNMGIVSTVDALTKIVNLIGADLGLHLPRESSEVSFYTLRLN